MASSPQVEVSIVQWSKRDTLFYEVAVFFPRKRIQVYYGPDYMSARISGLAVSDLLSLYGMDLIFLGEAIDLSTIRHTAQCVNGHIVSFFPFDTSNGHMNCPLCWERQLVSSWEPKSCSNSIVKRAKGEGR